MTDTGPTGSALKSLVEWIDAAADRFDAAWRERPHPPLSDFLSGTGRDRVQMLKELLKVDLEYRRRRGEPFRAEQYLTDWPELRCPDGGLPDDLVQYNRELDARFPPTAGTGEFTLPRTLGRFHFVELLGSGSFGSVYKARDADLGRLVAVKVPHPALVLLPAQRGRLAREAQSAAKLLHPNIVTVYEVAELDGAPCLVSEWVDGKTLAELREAGRPDPAWAATQAAAVADALQYAHSLGVVHRDVTPRNILIDDDRPRLTDFGLARQDGDALTLTAPGEVLGTPAYMSPEQARGDSHGVGPRSDVYSLGAVLYDLLTGGPPFTGPAHAVLARVQTEEPSRPRRANPAVPRDLETICLKCLEKEPAKRYATAADLAADLRRFVAGDPVAARPLGAIGRLARSCRRNPLTAALVGLVFVSLAAVAVAGFWVAESSRARERDRRREVLTQKLQRIRLAPKSLGWSAGSWRLVEEAARLRPSADLRDEAASILAGTDARLLWHNRLSGARAVAVSPDGRRFLVGTATETILLDGDAVAARVPGGGPVAFLPDGTPVHLRANAKSFTLAAVPDDRLLRTYSVPAGATGTRTDDGGRGLAALAPNGALVAALETPDGPRVALWPATGGGPGRVEPDAATAVAVSADGLHFAAGRADGTVRVHSADGARQAAFAVTRSRVLSLTFGPDGRRVAVGDSGGLVSVWDWAGGRVLPCFGSQYGVSALAFNADGTLLASGGRGVIILWDATTGRRVLDIPLGEYHFGLTFCGDVLAAAGRADGFHAVRIGQGDGFHTLRGLATPVSKLVLSPDGSRLAAMSHDWQVGVWAVASGHLLRRFDVPPGASADNAALAFDATGDRLAFAAGREARLWTLATRNEQKWEVNPGYVEMLAFDPAGRLLHARFETELGDRYPNSGAPFPEHQRVVRVRDLLSERPPEPLATIREFNRRVFDGRLTPDGSVLFVEGFHDGSDGRRRAVAGYDPLTGVEKWSIPLPPVESGDGLGMSADGRLGVYGPKEDTRVGAVFDVLKGRDLFRLPEKPLTLSNDGRLATWHGASPAGGGIGMVISADGDHPRSVTVGLDISLSTLPAFTGRLIVWANHDGTIGVCEVESLRAQLDAVGLSW